MQLTITLPPREETLAFHRQRWEEVVLDPRWNEHEGKIETNVYGQIVMTPPPAFIHGLRQACVARLIEEQLGGHSATECPVITSDGTKAVDVCWLSSGLFETIGRQTALETAPEICVEIQSPSNTDDEIQNKFRLYFDAGAHECWLCNLDGQMSYYHHDTPDESQPQSKLCPDFPNTIAP